MIKLLNESNVDDLSRLLSNINTVMGQDLNEVNPYSKKTRRELLVEKLTNDWLKWDSKSRNAIGWFEDGQLRTLLCQDFSVVVKAWAMSYYFSDYKDRRAIHTGTSCGEYAMSEAEKLGYYEYYRVIDSDKVKVWDRAWRDSIRSRYTMVVDEIVPALEKPMTTLAWDWLFETNAKTKDSAIVKGILKSEFRPY
jgi:hypothetical protein